MSFKELVVICRNKIFRDVGTEYKVYTPDNNNKKRLS